MTIYAKCAANGIVECAIEVTDWRDYDSGDLYPVSSELGREMMISPDDWHLSTLSNTFKRLPECTWRQYADWNPVSEKWSPRLSDAITDRSRLVSQRLSELSQEPVESHAGKFDADKVSRERISGMIARLQRGDGLPNGWIGWRDANNQQQWAEESAATVLANLVALSRAIEDREQALLVASWAHKAAIAALEDIDAILGYDVTTGWPT